jgi:hypothetical protein
MENEINKSLTELSFGKHLLKLPRLFCSYRSLYCIFLFLISYFSLFERVPSLCMRLLNYSALSFFVLLKVIKILTYFLLRLTDRFNKWNVSQIKSNFIFLSRGLSVPKEDKQLISINHGFSLESIMTSKPKI